MSGCSGPFTLRQSASTSSRSLSASSRRPALVVGNRQVVHRPERVGVFRADHLAAERQHLLPQLERLVPAAGVVVGNRQVVHRLERVGVFRADHLAAERQHLLPELERLSLAAGCRSRNRQIVHRTERVGVFRAGGGQIVIASLFLQRDGLAVEAQRVVGASRGWPGVWPGARAGWPIRSPASSPRRREFRRR